MRSNYSILENLVNNSKNITMINLIFKSIILYNLHSKLKLPGVGFNIHELISNNYQVPSF
jgi:hypothetical protein